MKPVLPVITQQPLFTDQSDRHLLGISTERGTDFFISLHKRLKQH